MERNNYCKHCLYFQGQFDENCCCNYIFLEGHRRPCPPGEGCTVRKRRPRPRRMRFDRQTEQKGGVCL